MVAKHELRVMFLGLRGFPGVQGGVENHAQHLCPLLVELGCEVTAVVRTSYMPSENGDSWAGVRFIRVWSPRSKNLEAIVHTLLGVLVAVWHRPDVLHIQAIGPALMVPVARLLGLRVVITHHSLNYEHQKWGGFARWALRTGERWGMRWSHARIVIADWLRELMMERHGVECVLIPNGVDVPLLPSTQGTLANFNLVPRRYCLIVGRLVPEKRQLDLIAAFERAALPGWKLAIVGASDHPDDYVQELLAKAKATPGVVCTGLQSGQALSELYAHAGFFVLPSSHEGLPIAMLEALSYGLPVVASDIPANLEVALSEEHYFPLGDVATLADRLKAFAAQALTDDRRDFRRRVVAERYDWRAIAKRTLAVYQEVLK
jgi:glycosyltransferase involved in cell wall biosynthesis